MTMGLVGDGSRIGVRDDDRGAAGMTNATDKIFYIKDLALAFPFAKFFLMDATASNTGSTPQCRSARIRPSWRAFSNIKKIFQ